MLKRSFVEKHQQNQKYIVPETYWKKLEIRTKFLLCFQDQEGMLGLSLQAILDYINSDNINGLRSFLSNKHVQVRMLVVQLL